MMNKFNLTNVDLKGMNFAGIKKGNIQIKIGGNTKMAYIGYARKID